MVDSDLTLDGIYNTDESAIRNICPQKWKTAGYKLNKVRLTMLVCTNASGTHKLKLLVLGKCVSSLFERNCEITSYIQILKTCMNESVSVYWLVISEVCSICKIRQTKFNMLISFRQL